MRLSNVLTPAQIAEKFQVTERTVLDWRKEGMPTIKIGKAVFVLESSFLKWLKDLENAERG